MRNRWCSAPEGGLYLQEKNPLEYPEPSISPRRRGVDVKIVIDEKGNRNRASLAAMNLIVNAGIPLRTNDRFPVQHDKILIVDNHTVESGSYNFSLAATTATSETSSAEKGREESRGRQRKLILTSFPHKNDTILIPFRFLTGKPGAGKTCFYPFPGLTN